MCGLQVRSSLLSGKVRDREQLRAHMSHGFQYTVVNMVGQGKCCGGRGKEENVQQRGLVWWSRGGFILRS